MSTRNIDLALLLLGVFLIVVSSYQLFFHQQRTFQAQEVGTLSGANAVVKTKGALTLDWQDAFIGNAVSANQLIYTDQNSSAEVSFLKGNQLSIGENSLVRIADSEATLDLERGFIRAKLQGETPMKLEMNGQEYELTGEGAEVQINLSESRGEIGVLKGNVQVEKEGRKENISPSIALTIEGEEMQTQAILFKTLNPSWGSRIFTDKDLVTIDFKWTPSGDGQVLISTSPQMTEARKLGAQAVLAPGVYYWRVESANGRSLVSSFRIEQEHPPQIIRPKNGESVQLKKEQSAPTELLLQWDGRPETQYVVEWEGKTFSVKGSSLLVPVRASGEKVWRVRIDDENRPLSKWSTAQVVNVDIISLPQAPKNLMPDGFEYQTYRRAGEHIEMSWETELPVEWELRGPKGEVQKEFIEENLKKVTVSQEGRYQWRVRAKDQFDRFGEWSEWKSFELIDLSDSGLQGSQKIQLRRPDQLVSFEWENKEGSLTKFELARDQEFNQVIFTKEVRANTTKTAVPEVGTYYWRSRHYLPDGTVDSSEPMKVIIEPVPAPEKPVKLPDLELPIEWRPKKTSWNILDIFISRAFASDLRGQVKVELPKSEEAKSIHLRIFRDAEMKEPVVDEQVTESHFIWKDARPGTYYWQYALIDYWDRKSPFSDPAILRVTGEEVLPPERPRLRSPIRASQVDKKDLRFYWKNSRSAILYHLEISQTKNFEEVFKEARTRRLNYRDSRWDFPPGLYFWRVTAADKYGQETTSNVGRFVILPPLERIVISDPPAEWIKKWKPRISFAWAPSLDAYEFESAEERGKIDGNALMGLELKGTYFFDNWIVNGEVLRQSGKVYDDQEYLFQRVLLDASRRFGALALGLGGAQTSAQEYVINNNVVTSSAVSSLSYGPVVRSYYALNRDWELQGRGLYFLGDIKQTELGAELLRSWGRSYFFSTGLSYAIREYKTSKAKQSSLRFSLGVGKEF